MTNQEFMKFQKKDRDRKMIVVGAASGFLFIVICVWAKFGDRINNWLNKTNKKAIKKTEQDLYKEYDNKIIDLHKRVLTYAKLNGNNINPNTTLSIHDISLEKNTTRESGYIWMVETHNRSMRNGVNILIYSNKNYIDQNNYYYFFEQGRIYLKYNRTDVKPIEIQDLELRQEIWEYRLCFAGVHLPKSLNKNLNKIAVKNDYENAQKMMDHLEDPDDKSIFEQYNQTLRTEQIQAIGLQQAFNPTNQQEGANLIKKYIKGEKAPDGS